jgi:energy-coupling factor transporter ATP-binding protein EcfA2
MLVAEDLALRSPICLTQSSMPAPRRRSKAFAKTPAEEGRPFGRLARLQIEGLLGGSPHDIELESIEPTILTGANGTGKSTILRLLNGVGSGSWSDVAASPFRALTLHFQEAAPLIIERDDTELRVAQTGSRTQKLPLELLLDDERGTSAIRRRMHTTMRHRRYSSLRQQQLFRDDLYLSELEHLTGLTIEPWFAAIPDKFSVRFITDQRLVVRSPEASDPNELESPEPVRRTVTNYSRDLGERMTQQLRQYAAASQREDRTFPQLVADAIVSRKPLSPAAIAKLLDDVGKQREALEQVGLAQAEPGPRFDKKTLNDDAVRVVIQTFAEVTKTKFEVLEELRQRLALFTDFLNHRFTGKTVHVRADRGLYFLLPDGSELEPVALSCLRGPLRHVGRHASADR